jgi:hypothetical protein
MENLIAVWDIAVELPPLAGHSGYGLLLAAIPDGWHLPIDEWLHDLS